MKRTPATPAYGRHRHRIGGADVGGMGTERIRLPRADSRRDSKPASLCRGLFLRSKRPGVYLVSFSTPVGLPGVSLGRGIYMFRYVGEGRSAIQVLNAAGTVSYGLFLPTAMPQRRRERRRGVADPTVSRRRSAPHPGVVRTRPVDTAPSSSISRWMRRSRRARR